MKQRGWCVGCQADYLELEMKLKTQPIVLIIHTYSCFSFVRSLDRTVTLLLLLPEDSFFVSCILKSCFALSTTHFFSSVVAFSRQSCDVFQS